MTLLARLLALILVAVLPAIAVLLYNEHDLRAAREETLRQEALLYARAAADELERVVEGARGFLLVVAQAPALRARDWQACGLYLTELAGIQPGYVRLAVVDGTGRIACASDPALADLTVTDTLHFREALARGDFAVGGFLTSRSSGIEMLPLAAAFRDADGEIIGVVMAGLKIDWLVRQIEQKERPADGTLLIADRKGTILARSPHPEQWVGHAIGPAWQPFAEAAGPGTTIVTDLDGVRRAYGYVPSGASTARLFVAGGIGTAQGLKDIEAASRRGLVMVALAGLVALIATWFVGDRLIRQPIHRLVGFTQEIGSGRYHQSLPGAPGEFGALTRAFADAARRLAAREAELRASETRFHRLADLTREGIAIHDGEQVIEANGAAAAMFGYQPDEVIGRPVIGFIAPEARGDARANMAAGREEPYESIGLRKDGSRFPVEIYARGIEYEGRPMRVIAARDLTRGRQAAETLRQAEERYRLAARATRDLIWDWDIEAGRIRFNESIHAMLGYSEEEGAEVAFQWWVDKIHADDRERVITGVQAALEATDESCQYEYRLLRADGAWVNVLDRGLIVRTPEGKAVRMIGAIIDLTGRKRAEASLRRAAERNQALLREADHRIKNNLQLVSSMLGLQRAALRDPAARQAFQDARLRIQSIARVHEGFYSTGDFERADFGEVLCTLRDSLLSDARGRPEIIVDAPPGCLVMAAKATPLALIANELITNALKHAFPPGRSGTVRASCARAPEGGLVLTVADDGIGLPPDFDLAAKAGFGLRLVRTLAGQIGGQVAVGGQGRGTVVEVRVPAAADPIRRG